MKSVASGLVSPDSVVMLNITGGGEKLFKSHHESVYLKPSEVFGFNESEPVIEEKVRALFA